MCTTLPPNTYIKFFHLHTTCIRFGPFVFFFSRLFEFVSVKMFFYIAFSFFVFLFFIYLKKCNQFWKNRGVPSTSPSLFFGDSGKAIFGVTPVYRVYEDIYNAFPHERYVGFHEFLQPLLLIRDPKLIESVFVKDFSYFSEHQLMKRENSVAKNLAFVHSKDWKYVRGKLTTNFSANKLKGMLVLMNKSADILDSVLRYDILCPT